MDVVHFDVLNEPDIDLIIAAKLLELKETQVIIRIERIDWMA